MGLYATTTSLDDIIVGMTFDTATTALGTKAIEHAEATINQYIGTRYDISGSPFDTSTTIPPKVKALAEQLSTGWMYTYNVRGNSSNKEHGMEIRKEALECLEMIRDSQISLFDSSGSIILDKSKTNFRIQSNTSSYTPTFGEDDSLLWGVDSDKLDDLDSDRD